VALLQKLGVNLPADGSFRFHGILYQEGNISTRAHFQGLTGIGMRRTTLQEALMQRAEDLGVHLMWGRQMRELLPTGARLSDGIIRARWTVAADGTLGLRYDPRLRDAVEAQSSGLEPPDLWPLFGMLDGLPLGLIRGANSDLLTPETAARMRDLRPDMDYAEIPDRGHVPFLDEPGSLVPSRGFWST
jgi:hypothetical protein